MFGFSKAWLYGAVLAALTGIAAFLRMDARKDERMDAKEADNERADDIRERVERGRADGLPDHKDSGWRD